MTTTTTLARSSDLGRQSIADGWLGYTNTPEVTEHPRYEALIEALIEATEAEADKLLPEGTHVFPHISEIVGPVGTDLGDDFDTEDLMRRAGEAVDYNAIEARVFGVDD